MASLSNFENAPDCGNLSSSFKMALQLIHHSVFLRSPALTASKSNNFVTVMCTQFHLEKKGMHAIILALVFHHLLIILRAAWEIFPIRKVQEFSTTIPPPFLGCFSCGKISQPGLVYKL